MTFDSGLISTIYGVTLFQEGYLKCWRGSRSSGSTKSWIEARIRSGCSISSGLDLIGSLESS